MDLSIEEKEAIEALEKPALLDVTAGVCPACDRPAQGELVPIAMLPAPLQAIMKAEAATAKA